MVKGLFRSSLHEHADPARRIAGIADLLPDSDELASLLADDPVPEVRVAAAKRCERLEALAAALEREREPGVQQALAEALGAMLATTADEAAASALLAEERCTDAIRADVARTTNDPARRRGAIASIRDEAALVDVALAAPHAETRLAAAERVRTPDGLRRLADAAKNKDHGVARIARKRLDAIDERATRAAEADAILAQLEALAGTPGPILSAVIELNRRWEALGLDDDAARLARGDAARQALQARFDREHEEARAQARLERRLADWLAQPPPTTAEALGERRTELAAVRDAMRERSDEATLVRLDAARTRIEQWTTELQAVAGAEALVVEAEQLAAGTSIDDAKLPERWQALDRAIRTPALTRRFEAALIVVEQRRLAQVRAAEQEAQAAKQKLHALLHAAEQALAAGQLQAARAAADEIRALKPGAGALPKPTVQRVGRLAQQLGELERWESFGQQQARVQLCERAEALAATIGDYARVAADVQKLRNEWKALDQQHAGVPKALWERFDHACEKAYAPAARHFAELAAQRKLSRKQRDEFIAGVAAHAPTLLGEPRDWRALERWLRETEHKWHGGELGSVEPKAWKTFDAQFKAAIAPVRDALAQARDEARARRQALIDEVTALAAKATDRDAPSQVKAVQAKWQAQAKEIALTQRDERALWERFRAACDAVFEARHVKRKEEDDRRHEGRRALESMCAELEQLAKATERDDADLRRATRELAEKWRQATRTPDPSARALESRFRNAKAAVEGALAARARAREAAVWQVLAAKERLCDELDRLSRASDALAGNGEAAASASSRWTEIAALPPSWEKAMLARRDAAAAALADAAGAGAHAARIEQSADTRREALLELEMLLGLESPRELQPQRLALQVKRLRDRFQSAAPAGADTARERLVAWCAQAGVADARDRERAERIFAAIERAG